MAAQGETVVIGDWNYYYRRKANAVKSLVLLLWRPQKEYLWRFPAGVHDGT